MFLIRWIRTLLSLPVLWLGQLTGMFKLPVAAPLLGLAWAIGRSGEVARMALVSIYTRQNREFALLRALRSAGWSAGVRRRRLSRPRQTSRRRPDGNAGDTRVATCGATSGRAGH